MKKSRGFSYPMPLEDAEELAREPSEFSYRETDDPDEAYRRRFYKVERWDAGEQHVIELVRASNAPPPRRYTLRQNIRVLERWPPDRA